jgi:hypothetical protein
MHSFRGYLFIIFVLGIFYSCERKTGESHVKPLILSPTAKITLLNGKVEIINSEKKIPIKSKIKKSFYRMENFSLTDDEVVQFSSSSPNYYLTESGKENVWQKKGGWSEGESFTYIDIFGEPESTYESYVGKQYQLLFRDGTTEKHIIKKILYYEEFSDAYPDDVDEIIRTPLLPILFEKNKRYKTPILAFDSKQKMNAIKIPLWEELNMDEKQYFDKRAKAYIKIKNFHPGYGKEKLSDERSKKSKNGKWVLVSYAYSSFLFFENNIVHFNLVDGEGTSSSIDLVASFQMFERTYLILKTSVDGIGTISSSLGIYPFKNGKFGFYIAPRVKPEHGYL